MIVVKAFVPKNMLAEIVEQLGNGRTE